MQVNKECNSHQEAGFSACTITNDHEFSSRVSNAADNSSSNNYLRISAIMHYALSVSDCGSVEVLRELVKENLKPRRRRGHPDKVKSSG